MRLSILIPLPKTGADLGRILSEISRIPWHLTPAVSLCEVVVVTDLENSRRAADLAANSQNTSRSHSDSVQLDIRLSVLGEKGGKGLALRTALDQSSGDIVTIIDPDQSFHSSAIPSLINPIAENQVDIVTDAGECRSLSGRIARSLRLTEEGRGIDVELTVRARNARLRVGTTGFPAKSSTQFDPLNIWRALKWRLFDREPFKPGLDQTLTSLEPHVQVIYARHLHRAMRQLFGKRSHVDDRPHILEVGSGTGSLTGELLAYGAVTATDSSAQYLDVIRRRALCEVNTLVWDATTKPPESWPKFDAIVAFNVLEHLPDDAAVVANWTAILREEGSLVVLVPNYPSLFSAADKAVGHLRRYTLDGLTKLLESQGLDVSQKFLCNPLGIAGWVVHSKWLGAATLPAASLWVYRLLTVAFRPLEFFVARWAGLSIVVVAQKKARRDSQKSVAMVA